MRQNDSQGFDEYMNVGRAMIVWHDHYQKAVFIDDCRHTAIITQPVRFGKASFIVSTIKKL